MNGQADRRASCRISAGAAARLLDIGVQPAMCRAVAKDLRQQGGGACRGDRQVSLEKMI